MSRSNVVSVYGTLKKGRGNHRLLVDAEYLGVDELSGWKMYSLGGCPGIVQGEGVIHVEVYKVNDNEFANLDRLEGFPTFYNRVKVHTQYGESWVYYLANENRFSECAVIADGRW